MTNAATKLVDLVKKPVIKSGFPETVSEEAPKKAKRLKKFSLKAEALVKKIEPLKQDLIDCATKDWFRYNREDANPYSSSIVIPIEGDDEQQVLVTFTQGYRSGKSKEELKKILTDEELERCFELSWTVAIKGADIPKESRDMFESGLMNLCHAVGLNPADVMSVKQAYLPQANFNTIRGSVLSKKKNKELNALIAVPSSLKVQNIPKKK